MNREEAEALVDEFDEAIMELRGLGREKTSADFTRFDTARAALIEAMVVEITPVAYMSEDGTMTMPAALWINPSVKAKFPVPLVRSE